MKYVRWLYDTWRDYWDRREFKATAICKDMRCSRDTEDYFREWKKNKRWYCGNCGCSRLEHGDRGGSHEILGKWCMCVNFIGYALNCRCVNSAPLPIQDARPGMNTFTSSGAIVSEETLDIVKPSKAKRAARKKFKKRVRGLKRTVASKK